jgi:3-hydroxyisobutyrate/3-hydroxypropionate dehydrogenase
MAKNLQSKLSPNDSIRIFDINKDAVQKLAKEMTSAETGGAIVEVAESAFDASNQAVRLCSTFCQPRFCVNDVFIILSLSFKMACGHRDDHH